MPIREDLVASAVSPLRLHDRPTSIQSDANIIVSYRPSVSHHPRACFRRRVSLWLPLTLPSLPVLQDPSVASSPVENRVAFLKAKNLTEEEVHAALAQAGGETAPNPSYSAPPPGAIPGQPPPYYGGYPPYGWQQPPPEVPRRDWRDWFIMATVVGGVGYGLYTLGKVHSLFEEYRRTQNANIDSDTSIHWSCHPRLSA